MRGGISTQKVGNMDKNKIIEIHEAMKTALEKVATEFNVNINTGNVSYTTEEFHTTLKVTEKEIDGKPIEQVNFEKYAHLFGFKKSDYGKIVKLNNRHFKLIGFKPSSPKYSVIAEDIVTGKEYKLKASAIKHENENVKRG